MIILFLLAALGCTAAEISTATFRTQTAMFGTDAGGSPCALAPELRGQINDASNPGHFNWHIYTRMNWGEPWYAGFRESQTLYRFKNQLHFERNLMPHMLGWFALRPDTSLEDAEWLLARAAGFDAGFALAASLASTAQLEADPNSADAAKQFGATPAILAALKQWETARMARAFPPPVKALLRDNAREFHLEPAGPGQWDLRAAHAARFTHGATQATASSFRFEQPNPAQPLQWIVHSTAKQPVSGVMVEVNGKLAVELNDRSLPPGGSLRYVGGAEALLCDASWKELARVPVDAGPVLVSPGAVEVKLGCAAATSGALNLELRSLAPATRIGAAIGAARRPEK